MAWTKKEEETLYKYYPTTPISDLIKLLPNKSKSQIKAKATYKKLKKAENYTPSRNKEWSNEEIKILETNYASSTIDELMQLLPNKDKEQIRRRAVYDNLTKNENILKQTIKKWTNEEIKILKQYYEVTPMEELEEMLPNKTHQQILSRARYEGLKKEKEFIDDYRLDKMMNARTNLWSEDEDAVLHKYLLSEGLDAVENMLEKRTIGQIKVRARHLGIDYYKNQEEWILIENYKEPYKEKTFTFKFKKRKV